MDRRHTTAWLLGLVASLLLAIVGLVGPAVPAAAAADFQDTVDYTLTNQSGKDFSGQQLANSSFAG
ncbi:MAG: hypothetical protein RLZZ560_1386, partial [Cyanobacteriota bacterium]